MTIYSFFIRPYIDSATDLGSEGSPFPACSDGAFIRGVKHMFTLFQFICYFCFNTSASPSQVTQQTVPATTTTTIAGANSTYLLANKEHLSDLHQKLAKLEIEEQMQQQKAEETLLLQRIKEKEEAIKRIQSSTTNNTSTQFEFAPPSLNDFASRDPAMTFSAANLPPPTTSQPSNHIAHTQNAAYFAAHLAYHGVRIMAI